MRTVALRALFVALAILAANGPTGCGSGVATEGENSIYAAAELGDAAGIRDALQYGFDVNQPDVNGMTLLHHAAAANQAEIVEMLTNDFAASVTVTDKQGRTPLAVAQASGSQDAMSILSQ